MLEGDEYYEKNYAHTTGGKGVASLNRGLKEGLTEEMTFVQRLEGYDLEGNCSKLREQ